MEKKISNILHVGLDVGSTTVKIVVMDENKNIVYKNYQRHFSDTKILFVMFLKSCMQSTPKICLLLRLLVLVLCLPLNFYK